MDKKSDALLRKLLKNWANRPRPPDNGKARLIWEAARVSQIKIDLAVILLRPKYTSFTSSSSNDWSQTLFSWINENSTQLGIQARLI